MCSCVPRSIANPMKFKKKKKEGKKHFHWEDIHTRRNHILYNKSWV